MRRYILPALAVLGFAPAAVALSDTEPPVLVAFDFDPKSVDVTSGPALVDCVFSATDSPAGVTTNFLSARSPSGAKQASCSNPTPISGDAYDGTWGCTLTIPQYTEEGAWRIDHLSLNDAAGNHIEYSESDLQALGFPTTLQVVSNEDAAAPSLTGFDFDPKSVDVTSGPALVDCVFSATDSPAGVTTNFLLARSPSGAKQASCSNPTPISGDAYDGTWGCTLTIPQYTEEGAWRIDHLSLNDAAGNHIEYSESDLQALGFPTTLQVVSNEDAAAPSLTGFDFDPKSVDVTSGPALVDCVFSATDSPAGVTTNFLLARSPSGAKQASCSNPTPISGDAYDGTWGCTLTIPQYTEEGAWRIDHLSLNDAAGNHIEYSESDLQALGFPTTLVVGFVAGPPVAVISSPRTGETIRGNSITVRARLVQGSPGDVSSTLGVRFDYRALPFGTFAPILARLPHHPNPDTTIPYFVHWDVTSLPNGDYELRAVAHDLADNSDPAPETITITVDHAGSVDVDESVNPEGLQESQTAVDDSADNVVASGDHTDVSTATELMLPVGSLIFATDTANLLYPDPATEKDTLEQPGQSIGVFVDLSLQSGQTDLEDNLLADLNVSFSDADQDGVVDGTSIREEDLELRRYEDGSGAYVVVPSIVLTEHNMVHADVASLGKFALTGPLQPRLWIDADKQSVMWDAVSTAVSYDVYRGTLAALVDTDSDGLPDGGYGDCQNHLDSDVTDTVFVDPEIPAAGVGFAYLAAFVDSSGPTGLGNTAAGLRREVTMVCP